LLPVPGGADISTQRYANRGGRAAKAKLEETMTEPLSENQKSLLVIRAPLSGDGFVSIYFSSENGRMMSLSEWSNLKQLIELISKVCVKQEVKAQAAAA
jgi:hypothetical protein